MGQLTFERGEGARGEPVGLPDVAGLTTPVSVDGTAGGRKEDGSCSPAIYGGDKGARPGAVAGLL